MCLLYEDSASDSLFKFEQSPTQLTFRASHKLIMQSCQSNSLGNILKKWLKSVSKIHNLIVWHKSNKIPTVLCKSWFENT